MGEEATGARDEMSVEESMYEDGDDDDDDNDGAVVFERASASGSSVDMEVDEDDTVEDEFEPVQDLRGDPDWRATLERGETLQSDIDEVEESEEKNSKRDVR